MIILFHIFVTGICSAFLLYMSLAGGIKINNRFFKRADGSNNRSDELVVGLLFTSLSVVTGAWSWLLGSGSLYSMFLSLSAISLFLGTLLLTGMFIHFLVFKKRSEDTDKPLQEFEDI